MTATADVVQATQDRPPVRTRRQMNVIFGTVLLGMLLAALDQTIVSTALPTIVGDLGGAGHLSWVVSAYLLAETVSSVLAGRFGDMFGRKRIFQLSALIFVVGSFFCGLAHNMLTLVLMRGVQGIGGGGLMVTSMALIADVIPLRERGKYQGVHPQTIQSPKALHALPPEQSAPITHAYAESIQSVFRFAIPVASGRAACSALILKEVPLRDLGKAGSTDVGDAFGSPETGTSDCELERLVARLLRKEGPQATAAVMAASGSKLNEAGAWCVTQVHLRSAFDGDTGLKAIARAHDLPAAVLEPAFRRTDPRRVRHRSTAPN